jgi:predicted site-specific integrase-resolvase
MHGCYRTHRANRNYYKHEKCRYVGGSGLNDRRLKFLKLLADPSIGVIILDHRDREPALGLSTLSNCSL